MIFVTGGAGYLGTPLVEELLSMGEEVRVVDTLWFGNHLSPHERLDIIQDDIRHFNPAWLEDAHAVIHLAGLSNDPTADFAPALNNESNIWATRQLAQAVANRTREEDREIRFLFASTCSVYHTSSEHSHVDVEKETEDSPVAPTANYSKTKRLAEIELLNLMHQYPLFCPVILRKGTIFGFSRRMRFDLVVNTFTLNAWRHRLLTVHGSGEVWRPLLHIRDAIDAYLHLLHAPTEKVRGETFNIVHKNYRILELAHWVSEIIEEERGVEVLVKRDRTKDDAARSYYVRGDKIFRSLGFRAERGATQAILPIWDALERGDFGERPENDFSYFNIRWLQENNEGLM